MTQFQFKFDIPSDSDSPHTQALSENQEEEKEPSPTTLESKHRFKLIQNVPQLLRDRRQVDLEYETIDLNSALEGAAPLLQVCSNVGTEPEPDSLVQDIQRQQIDLLPGVYEGGLKVWECSLDLSRYLAMECCEMVSKGGSVLELGCGHALPACLFLREGLKRNKNVSVMFTDYNDFVLRGVALSNIALNTRSVADTTEESIRSIVADHIILGAGDWMDMSSQLICGALQKENPLLPRNGRFDIVLAAETTYTTEAAKDTAILLARHLKPRSGIGLVACKRYYFGVGGGSDAFREAAESQRITIDTPGAEVEHRLSIETLQVYDNGAGNIRELLRIKCVPYCS